MNTFYWYPKCSTCQKAKKKLQALSIPVNMIDMIENPPSKETIKFWLSHFNLDVKTLFNTSGLVYRSLNLKETFSTYTEVQLIQMLSENGMLIKRPILVSDEKIVVGYNEVNYEAFLQ